MNLKCQWETLVSEFVSSSDKEIICEDQNNIINKLNKQVYTFNSL